jgi:hypothetical protein
MKIKLWCKLFGHDFRGINVDIDKEGYRVVTRTRSNVCRNCGLTKEEVFKVVI